MLRNYRLQAGLIKNFVGKVFPMVDAQLQEYLLKLENCPSKELAAQARASITSKRFHAQGGSIYGLYPGVPSGEFVRFVVSLQTISDYLDNLCDRAGVLDEQSFRQLHLAMVAAVDPELETHQAYYLHYPYQGDGGYLVSLVDTCQQVLRKHLPGYPQAKKEILHLAGLYSELQSLKHLSLEVREDKLFTWAEEFRPPELFPWEFAAATGSTLGMFVLAAAAHRKDLTKNQVQEIYSAYFPWITGLHILLDYFIDQEEDQSSGDLNFVFYYSSPEECEERLQLFLQQSLALAGTLDYPWFHETVIQGLLAMYLSDAKALQGRKRDITQGLLKTGGKKVQFLHKICSVLRRKGII